jgi:hypothetical protein
MENKKTTTLTLNQVYELESEISGIKYDDNVILEGLLSQKLSVITKYHLNKMVNILKEEKKLIDDTRNELIKKYGEESEGSIVIKPTIVIYEFDDQGLEIPKTIQNPKYVEFTLEFNKLMEVKKDIEHHVFTIDDFSKIETSDDYKVFYKLLD